ncbi:MAG: hypothetical protein M1828_002232 [Chrysothrix sp. TS-e1954]|nr:MAG: hypothetical protein M1828_002232 [Chrysothrix sp. TS-e1954]
MDSMRTLDTSLPKSTAKKRPHQQSGELLQAFKAAAFSVTQLYKTAASEEDTSRAGRIAGYQEALEDLQDFLDRQNIGLDDGEGWQVRQWALQRSAGVATQSDAEDEVEEEKRTRSTSPTLQRRTNGERSRSSPRTSSEELPRSESMPPAGASSTTTIAPATAQSSRPPEPFLFRSNVAAPPQMRDIDMDALESTINASAVKPGTALNPTAPIQLEVKQKPSRSALARQSNHNRERVSSRRAGIKRKASVHEFFDISGLNGDDERGGGGGGGAGGGKRGRLN